jgi:hypothetical protein
VHPETKRGLARISILRAIVCAMGLGACGAECAHANLYPDLTWADGTRGPIVASSSMDDSARVLERLLNFGNTGGTQFLAAGSGRGATTIGPRVDSVSYASLSSRVNGSTDTTAGPVTAWIQIVSQNGGGIWLPAVDLNTPADSSDAWFVPSAWPTGDMNVGDFGVDTTNPVYWGGVVDHNSVFAVLPEPGTLGLLVLSALGVGMRRHRQRMG